jgi:dipeptidyl aminopeptidase/acylaminoacyl peptidase
MRRSFLPILLMSSLFALKVNADDPGKPKPPTDTTVSESQWTVDDVLFTESASDMQIAPDGHSVVWVKSQYNKEHGRLSQLVFTRFGEDKGLQLTRGIVSCTRPRWSPDGKTLAFLSARPAPDGKAGKDDEPKPQVWLIDPSGGEPWRLSEYARGVNSFEWADSDTILFTAQEEATLRENTTKDEKKDTSLVVEDEEHAAPVRLFKLSVKEKKVRRLTDNADRIQNFAVAPDGRRVVAIHERSLRYVYDELVKPVVFLHDLEKGESKQIFEGPKFRIQEVRWTHDGKGFYASSAFTNHPHYSMATISELYYYDLDQRIPVKVDLQWDKGLSFDFEVTEDGILALLADGARHRIARYIREGVQWRRAWLEAEQATNMFDLALSKDGKNLLYAYATGQTPGQWYWGHLEGARVDAPRKFTTLNSAFDKKTRAKTEIVHWKGALDEQVEGILYYPHDYQAGKKYPLVVMIHGGPAGADFDTWSDSWAYPHNLLTQRGAFVFKPNYHGSSNYGLPWVESISAGKYYDLEVPDIEKGVDELIARGLVDPEQLGVMGWSNGSILTIALTVNSTRYKAASAGAGDVDWVSDWGNCEFGAAFDNYYLGKTPLEDPRLYHDKSPFYKLDRVRTPTLIFFGTEDTKVPTQQGWMHYRALQQLGKTDVRFILFPGEGHGPRKLAHQRRKLEEELAWFDKYLFHTAKTANEAFKSDSPLARALQLQGAKRVDGRYGLMEKGCLIPETVAHAKLTLGRFEVTRAQFAQFDRSYPVEPGKENYPANGISFEQAQAYCAWLSKITGESYRLPTQAESDTLEESAGKEENTLDFWAGYAVNPDDAIRLRDKLKELTGQGALLKEVGSFPGVGKEDQVFDLGGNVAEWAVTKDGRGCAGGGSADLPADGKERRRKPAAEYIGFRVVRGADLTQRN